MKLQRICMGIVTLAVTVLWAGGCAPSQSDMSAVRELIAFARQEDVSGSMRVRINADAEMGLSHSIFMRSAGTSAEADLRFDTGASTSEVSGE